MLASQRLRVRRRHLRSRQRPLSAYRPGARQLPRLDDLSDQVHVRGSHAFYGAHRIGPVALGPKAYIPYCGSAALHSTSSASGSPLSKITGADMVWLWPSQIWPVSATIAIAGLSAVVMLSPANMPHCPPSNSCGICPVSPPATPQPFGQLRCQLAG